MSETCYYCRKPNPNRKCGLCQKELCKNCGEAFSAESLEFLSPKPEALSHSFYCHDCFETEVLPVQTKYNETIEQARELPIWSKTYRGSIPILKKAKLTVTVSGISDKKEAVLAIAYKALELGYNGVSRLVLDSEKIRMKNDPRGYQKMSWSAEGLPVMIDAEKLAREVDREVLWRELHHR